jgi:hypothetical protein
VEIIVAFPPNYSEIANKFQVTPRTIYAYGDKIYNPSGMRISGDLMAHEKVHSKQQAAFGSVEKWWAKYLSDEVFVLNQESEAYGRQYAYLCSQNPNRNLQFEILKALALLLAGPMYGFVIGVEAAMTLIREQSL